MNENRGLEHIRRLLRDAVPPELEGELAENAILGEIHGDFTMIREIMKAFSMGDYSPAIKGRGFTRGCLKKLQTRLRELDTTLEDLKHKEETLLALTDNLRDEVKHRGSKVEALRESEAHFKYLASHDALTGIYNRRSFIEIATAQMNHAFRNRINCCMAILDIDHFKLFNDTYGHIAGDEAIRHIVRVVSEGLRKGDFLGRYGGEEFILFFYNSSEERGFAIAERLRVSLEALPVRLDKQSVVVTASLGVAMAGGRDMSEQYIQRLIHNADIALYAAKRSGRNKVVLYSPKLEDEFDAALPEEKSGAVQYPKTGARM